MAELFRVLLHGEDWRIPPELLAGAGYSPAPPLWSRSLVADEQPLDFYTVRFEVAESAEAASEQAITSLQAEMDVWLKDEPQESARISVEETTPPEDYYRTFTDVSFLSTDREQALELARDYTGGYAGFLWFAASVTRESR
jgi:hypothetical protein